MRKFNLRLIEILHLPIWYLTDFFWMAEIAWAAVALIVPLVVMGGYITYRSASSRVAFLPNCAVFCWIIANTLWMCDDFYPINVIKIAYVIFGIGIFILLYWFIMIFPKLKMKR
ncbi:MAG: hypothetical protein NW207_00490 [Cytophagales bacterium]|nr:hypothetical protein [Cytophagales bacterium]